MQYLIIHHKKDDRWVLRRVGNKKASTLSSLNWGYHRPYLMGEAIENTLKEGDSLTIQDAEGNLEYTIQKL